MSVIIIGGGPAGAALGCYLSKAGIKNTIIEKSNHPRPHVGESLVHNTVRIFREIDFLDTMEQEGFVHKYGATWHAPSSQGSLSIVFQEFPVDGVNQAYTYHVDRRYFDLHLLKHAESLGSIVYQGIPVTKVLFDGDQASGVQVRLDGQEVALSADIVVDASGRNTFLGRHLRLKKKDPHFNQFAIHAWYKDVDRTDPATGDDIHIYFLPIEKGWIWQIPISEEVTSVGVVTEKNDFLKSGMDQEAFFMHHVQTTPNSSRALSNAKRINEFKTEGDYSYSMTKFVGNGYMMIGDAARFVDPIFSSGVSVALHSAKFASEQIVHAFEIDDFSEITLKPYEEKLRAGVEIWYEFIRLYYKLIPLFTHFIQIPDYREQLFQLLQGEVYNRDEVPVLEAMRAYIAKVETSEKHLLHDRLMDVPID